MKKTFLILTAIIGIASCSQNNDTAGQNLNGNGNDTTSTTYPKAWSVSAYCTYVDYMYIGGGGYTQNPDGSINNPDYRFTVRLQKTGSYTADSLTVIQMAKDSLRNHDYVNKHFSDRLHGTQLDGQPGDTLIRFRVNSAICSNY